MNDDASPFLNRLQAELERLGKPAAVNKRHRARNSREYHQIKQEAAAEVDALCERVIRDIRAGIADIDKVVGPIAEPMAEQLAKGAVSDVFAAAAEVLKAQIRHNP